MFIPAFIYKTDKITDISYAVTFATVAAAGYVRSTQTNLHKLITFLVLLWSFRLGTFLFIRINRIGKDVRFDGMREHFFLFLRFWVLQGATVFVVMLAPIFVYIQKAPSVSLITIVGSILFLAGLLIEAIADSQKFEFNNDSKNKGKWIDVGIWRASRHPNYLGEMMVWTGMYAVVFSTLNATHRLIALASPLYIIGLLLFVSGVPLLEKSARLKWGKDMKYVEYTKKVPVLLPTLKSAKRVIES